MKIFCLLLLLTGTLSFAEEPPAPPKRADLEQRLDAQWAKLPVEAKARMFRLHRALTQMPPEDRRFIHDRIERFLTMPPAERERLRRNRAKWERMTPEQREQARQEFRKRRAELAPAEPPSTPETNNAQGTTP